MARKLSKREQQIEARIKRAESRLVALNSQLKGMEENGQNSTMQYLKLWKQRNRLQVTINKMYQATY